MAMEGTSFSVIDRKSGLVHASVAPEKADSNSAWNLCREIKRNFLESGLSVLGLDMVVSVELLA